MLNYSIFTKAVCAFVNADKNFFAWLSPCFGGFCHCTTIELLYFLWSSYWYKLFRAQKCCHKLLQNFYILLSNKMFHIGAKKICILVKSSPSNDVELGGAWSSTQTHTLTNWQIDMQYVCSIDGGGLARLFLYPCLQGPVVKKDERRFVYVPSLLAPKKFSPHSSCV